MKLIPERSTSTPNIGSVIMRNSTGIDAMLGNGKRKRADDPKALKLAKAKAKRSSIKLVPEAQRFFAGKVLYFIPPDDTHLTRRMRINKAREYGATWSNVWTPDITHVVVDKEYKYQEVIAYLSRNIKVDSIPSHMHLVNEEYTIDCAEHKYLVDPDQKRYHVVGSKQSLATPARQASPPPASQDSNESLQVKPSKPKKGEIVIEEQTPSQSQRFSQAENGNADPTSEPWLDTENGSGGAISGSPRQSPPPNDAYKRGDTLDEIIETLRKFEGLPVDEDDDEEDRPSSADDPAESGGSEEERARMKNPKKYSKYPKKGPVTEKGFVCMAGGTGVSLSDNPNRHTIKILDEMCDYYAAIKDQWRIQAYHKAIGMLKAQTVYIQTYDHAMSLRYFGPRLSAKLAEIVTTGHLRRLDYTKMDPSDQTLMLVLKIYEVGYATAMQWIAAGHKTLEDLLALPSLHKNQRIGIERYDDFNTRIPRDEMTALGEIVKRVAGELDPDVEVIIGGSYRRGAKNSGDIDFILTKAGTEATQGLMSFLNALVDRLTRDRFLVAPLAVNSGEIGSKWHGCCVLPGNSIWRRIDFLVVPETEFGAALIYFTGDELFNRSMRLMARKKGMGLNQRGLFKNVLRDSQGKKLNDGTLVEGADEKKIFEILGVPWRPPHERICT